MVGADPNPDPSLGLRGRLIVVTGAARGIGAAVARVLAALGADLILADLQDCAETLADCGAGASAMPLDLARADSIAGLMAHVAGRGPLWGVVNCAALLLRTPFAELDETVMAREIAVNQTGALLLARAALDEIARHGRGGRLVMFTSQGAHTGGFHGSASYAMTKAAVAVLVKSLAREAAAQGITVNALAPGAVDTPMLRGGMSADDLAAFRTRIPMGRFAQPEEMARACAFLLSDWSSYVTGTTLHVNGGQYMP